MKKYKLLFCSLGLFFPGTGLNCFYLQGLKSFWAWAQLFSFIGGIAGWLILKDTHFNSAPGWVLITFGFITLEASWLTTIAYFNGSDNNVFIDGISCVFEEGIISNEIDVAFIKIGGNVQVNNQLSSEVQISDYVEGPITSDAINQVVNVYVNKEPGIKSSKVGNNSAIFYSGFRDIALEDVLMLDPVVTNKGNSGCPVMIDDSLLGIIVGGDSKYSYAIPYFKIKNFKPLDIL